ncbi:AAA family ATPase [Nonomuraea polychroma]|uniref:AAA family ATPase n=1 Tax=Nonomuraea polychroma TaxID=46176 RepID=UPI001F4E58ED|nr:ATP-binding protein [Nonomuraea polychroma]
MDPVIKPEYVFDRDEEWAALVRFATSPSADVRLGIVSGRRRQGKTFLLDALVQEAGGFYFTGLEETEAEALARFGQRLAARTGGGRYAFANWDEALERLFAVVQEGIIVIDEFPYLTKASPSLPSLIQHALDPRGYIRRGNARLLLCGSAMGVMGKLLAGNAPLRGRASLEMVVKPLDYRASAEFWGTDDPRLAVLVHSIVGGTPAYRREFVAGDAPASMDDFDAWVLRTVLNRQMPLFREARYLLAEEADIRDMALYHAVLGAIAAGNATRGGIANHIGRKSPDIGHPLAVLEDSHLIAREADAFRKGKSLFRICEPLIVFYEAVMRSEWPRLERGRSEAAWHDSRARFLSQVVGPHFEGLCREWAMLAEAEVFGDFPGEVAAGTVADPVNRTQIEVDVAVLAPEEHGRPRRVLSLGEVKWDKVMTSGHVDRLRRARDLLSAKGYDTRGTVLACYSGAGFQEDIPRDVRLIGLESLYS